MPWSFLSTTGSHASQKVPWAKLRRAGESQFQKKQFQERRYGNEVPFSLLQTPRDVKVEGG